MLNNAKDANKAISNGLIICRTKVYPSKLKQEPTQCMKCRKWGHFASDCTETKDICGTCGDDHRTNTCTETRKRYCVSCNAYSHSSWDRGCPEFAKRCSWYDTKHPDNLLKYFPTPEESRTLATRPERIPIPERFPIRYAVGSLPPPNRNGREPPMRIISRHQRRQRARSKELGTQLQEETQLTPSQRAAGLSERKDSEVSTHDYHTPDKFPSWDDASSFDDRTSWI